LMLGTATLLPTMFFGSFLNHSASTPVFSWAVIGIALLALAGLASLGVLLSAMTLKANSRQILYPLLYFPLTTPVLLAAIQSSILILQKGAFPDTARPWVGLLLGFDAIYLTLGILLYPELMDET
jgi:heme exporter protein B